MWLSEPDFMSVIQSTPLVSIDLILRNEAGDVLLGKRKNRPAKSFWFVPGGRVLKGEEIHKAINRISRNELNCDLLDQDMRFLGVYEHFYDDSMFSDDISTHYVVLGYQAEITLELSLPFEQHFDYKWFSLDEVKRNPLVHQNTRAYFN